MAEESKVKFVDLKTRGDVLIFVLGNGARLEFDPASVSDKIRHKAMLHGFTQKFRDSTASLSKAKDYAGALAAMQLVKDTLTIDDEWNRKGGNKAAIVEADLAVALARYKKTDDIAKCLLVVQKADTATREKWLENKTMAAYYVQAKADRMAKEAESGSGDEELDIPDID